MTRFLLRFFLIFWRLERKFPLPYISASLDTQLFP